MKDITDLLADAIAKANTNKPAYIARLPDGLFVGYHRPVKTRGAAMRLTNPDTFKRYYGDVEIIQVKEKEHEN